MAFESLARKSALLIGAVCLSLGVAAGAGACANDDADGASDDSAEATTTTDATQTTDGAADDDEEFEVSIGLSGSEEAPGPGDPDGSGTAVVTIAPGADELCYSLEVENVADITAAHVHEGRPGMAGPVAVALDPPADGASEGCVSTTSSILDGMRDGSRSFYVNIHSKEFPDGAVRGQVTGS